MPKFLSRDGFARVFQHQHQHRERLFLQPDSETVFAKLTRTQVHFEDIKTDNSGRLTFCSHREHSIGQSLAPPDYLEKS